MTNENASGLITSRTEFQTALREAFEQAAAQGAHELWLCDEDFSQWPLGDAAMIETLTQWAAGKRRMTLIARHFDEVARSHPRWVQWRRLHAHLVSCRANTEGCNRRIPDHLHCDERDQRSSVRHHEISWSAFNGTSRRGFGQGAS